MAENAHDIITDLVRKEGTLVKAARYMALCVAARIDERVALNTLDDMKKKGEIEFLSDGIFEVL